MDDVDALDVAIGLLVAMNSQPEPVRRSKPKRGRKAAFA
jgi:hypothetical protein